MSEVTEILCAIEQGHPQAAEQLLPLVYDELRKLAAGHMANELPGHTLDATGLVHEAYLRLGGAETIGPILLGNRRAGSRFAGGRRHRGHRCDDRRRRHGRRRVAGSAWQFLRCRNRIQGGLGGC